MTVDPDAPPSPVAAEAREALLDVVATHARRHGWTVTARAIEEAATGGIPDDVAEVIAGRDSWRLIAHSEDPERFVLVVVRDGEQIEVHFDNGGQP